MTRRLRIAIPLFPRFTALDAIGPYEVLQRIPAFDITFVGHTKGEVRADNGMLGLVIDGTFEDLPDPDVTGAMIEYTGAGGVAVHRKTLAEMIGARARSRLFEMCRVVKMPAVEDYRVKRGR